VPSSDNLGRVPPPSSRVIKEQPKQCFGIHFDNPDKEGGREVLSNISVITLTAGMHMEGARS